MSIRALPYCFDVSAVQAQLAKHPDAWDEYSWRTEHPRSPHRECSDIWMRYNAFENLGDRFNDEHDAVWYPVADDLPAARRIALAMSDLRAQRLAGVLITRVPLGKRVYPHVDRGWHAEHTDKIGVLIKGNSAQRFCFRDISHGCHEGETFEFSNQAPHWVTNDTPDDRITLIICLRKS